MFFSAIPLCSLFLDTYSQVAGGSLFAKCRYTALMTPERRSFTMGIFLTEGQRPKNRAINATYKEFGQQSGFDNVERGNQTL